ncbi:MAG: hypothetical protein ACLPYS_05745 [Vulcanimicrobiaceae bacterium]
MGAVYEAVNRATVDAYFVGALLNPRQPVGGLEPCLRTDNRMASRPSPLANPPFPESSIAQRRGLAAALAAYDVALASFAGAEPSAATQVATSELQHAAFELKAAANAHAQGDLFIEDLAAMFSGIAGKLAGARDRDAARLVARDAEPTVAKLNSILAADVARQRSAALSAAHLDYDRWVVYYEKARREATGGGPAAQATAAAVRCLAPAVPQSESTSPVVDVVNDGASFAGRDTILARLRAAGARYDALRNSNPGDLISALGGLDEALSRALQAPSDARSAGDVQSALGRFRDAAQAGASAARSVESASAQHCVRQQQRRQAHLGGGDQPFPGCLRRERPCEQVALQLGLVDH